MFSLIDIGANLTHDSFDADRPAVLERACAVGVDRLIVTGTSVTQSARALELAREHPGRLFATAGVHPHHAKTFDAHSAAALRLLAESAEVVAIGECGLDYYRDFSPRVQQRGAFSAQLELAAELRLPVFLHQRDAHAEWLSLLSAVRDRLSGGVAHCFTGGPDELRACLDLDLYVGITGWLCDERRGAALREAVTYLPLERVLIETDAPYLLPRDLPEAPRTRRNEPRFLPHVLRRLASAMNRPPQVVAEATRRNAEALFGLKAPGAGGG